MDFLNSILAFNLTDLPYVIIVLLIAFTVHEFAHAYVAYRFGDPTAKNQGRLTLNPKEHLDPVGTLLLLIFGFGWARPVPVNRYNFKNPRLAGILVSAAGPLSNLLIAIFGYVIFFLMLSSGAAGSWTEYVFTFINFLVYINILLFVFNLLPIPPLDGYRIIEDLMPVGIRAKMTQYEQYGMLIFLILVLTPLGDYTIDPIFRTLIPGIQDFLSQLFYSLFM